MASRNTFDKFVQNVKVASQTIKKYLRKGWGMYTRPDTGLMSELKEIKSDTKRPGVYGYAMLGSKIITLNPTPLGTNDMLWATSALHEAMHANRSTGERGALGKEFEFLGRQYSRGYDLKNVGMMKNAIRCGVIAERQWSTDVSHTDGEEHLSDLVGLGFTKDAANTIIREGRRYGE